LEGLEQVNTNVLIGLMSVVRLCAGVESAPSAASAPQGDAASNSGSSASTIPTADAVPEATSGASRSDDVDDLSVLAVEVSEPIPNSEPTSPGPVLPETETLRNKAVDEATGERDGECSADSAVIALVPAVFGHGKGDMEGRKRFIRCMLEC
jgi:hypothetical protein